MPLTPEQLYQEAAGGLAAALALCLLGYLGTKLAAHAWRAVTVGNGYRRWMLRRRRSAGLLLLLGAVSGSVVADAQDLAPLDPAEVRRVALDAGLDSLRNVEIPKPANFPFHQLEHPEDRTSTVLHDTNDVVSSQGVFRANFTGLAPGSPTDLGTPAADPVFNVGGVNVRRGQPRNTPSIINAVFNF